MSISRYPGTISFEDDNVSAATFFGREFEKEKLFQIIISDSLTLLYAKSGTGKTSLLQAGLFDKLRENFFIPIPVRFNKIELSPEQCIYEAVRDSEDNNHKIELLNLNSSVISLEDIPLLFKQTEFWSQDNKLFTPILILDQFEQMFTLAHNRSYHARFFKTLRILLTEIGDRNLSLKIIISIREDFLGQLENLAKDIPKIFSNRFRLAPLTLSGAKDAITKPSALDSTKLKLDGMHFKSPPFSFSDMAIGNLLDYLAMKWVLVDEHKTEEIQGESDSNKEIDTITLQIICSDIEERVCSGEISEEGGELLVREDDLGGIAGMHKIFRNYYAKQLSNIEERLGLSDVQVENIRDLIEKDLIVSKRRVPLDRSSILRQRNITEEAIDFLLESKLLKEENWGRNNKLIELSHDALVRPILFFLENREAVKRETDLKNEFEREQTRLNREKDEIEQELLLEKERNRNKKQKFYNNIYKGVVLVVLCLAGLSYYYFDDVNGKYQSYVHFNKILLAQKDSLNHQKEKNLALETQARKSSDSVMAIIRIKNDSILKLNKNVNSRNEDLLLVKESLENQVNQDRSIIVSLTRERDLALSVQNKLIVEKDSVSIKLRNLASQLEEIDRTKILEAQKLLDNIKKTDILDDEKTQQEFAKKGWVKEGYFLQFDNIRVLLTNLNKFSSFAEIEICDATGADKCTVTLGPKRLNEHKPQTFFDTNFKYTIELYDIGMAGKNFLNQAAYISLKKEKMDSLKKNNSE